MLKSLFSAAEKKRGVIHVPLKHIYPEQRTTLH